MIGVKGKLCSDRAKSLDLINRTSLLNRINDMIHEFDLLGDIDTVKILVFCKLVILNQPNVDIDKAFKIWNDVEGYME